MFSRIKQVAKIGKTNPSNIYVIGNADQKENISHLVRPTDIVVRFNKPNPTCSLKADILFVANGAFNVSKSIFSPYRKKNYKTILRDTPGETLLNKKTKTKLFKRLKFLYRYPIFLRKSRLINREYLSPEIHSKAVQYLQLDREKEPSTGFLAIIYLLENYPDTPIILHNFTFQGWEGHNFSAEKQFVQDRIAQGKIQFKG